MDIDDDPTTEILHNIKREKDEFVRKTSSLSRQSNSMVNALKEKTYFQDIMDIDLQFDSSKPVTKKVTCAMFGKTSSGKSSVINAIIGTKVMHTSKGVSTKCLIKLNGYNGENISLVDELGKEHPIESINEINNTINTVTATGNTYINALFPLTQYPRFNNFCDLMDSPGIDSGCLSVSTIEKYFHNGDIFVYVIDGECNLGVTDREFLKNIKNKFNNSIILFLINKWDRCDEEENIDELRQQSIDAIRTSLVEDLQYSKEAEEISFFISATESLYPKNENMSSAKMQRIGEFERFISVLQKAKSENIVHSKQSDYLIRLGENLNIEINIPEEETEERLKYRIKELIKETFVNINRNVHEKVDEHFSEFSFTKSGNVGQSSTSSIDDIIQNILESTAYVELDELSNQIRTMMTEVCPFIIGKDDKKSYDLTVPRDSPKIDSLVTCNDMNNYYQWRDLAIDQGSKYKFRAGLISLAICLMVKFHNFLNPIKKEKEKFEAQLRAMINKSIDKTLKDCQTSIEKDAMLKLDLFMKDYHELCNMANFIQKIKRELSIMKR